MFANSRLLNLIQAAKLLGNPSWPFAQQVQRTTFCSYSLPLTSFPKCQGRQKGRIWCKTLALSAAFIWAISAAVTSTQWKTYQQDVQWWRSRHLDRHWERNFWGAAPFFGFFARSPTSCIKVSLRSTEKGVARMHKNDGIFSIMTTKFKLLQAWK